MSEVIVTTAIALSAKQLETIKTALTKKLGAKLTIQEVVEPSVVGGISIRIGSQELNATVKDKLHQVQSQLLATI